MDRRDIVIGLLALLVVACDSSSGSGDAETHWIKCETDATCPTHQVCVAKRCVPLTDGAAGGASGQPGSTGGSGNVGKGGTSGSGATTSSSGGRASSNGGSPETSTDGGSDASIDGTSDASAAGGAGSSAGGAASAGSGGASDATTGDVRDASADGAGDSSVEAGIIGHDAADSAVAISCAAPGSDYFVDPVGGSDDTGTGSGMSSGGAPTPACAFKTITHALQALPATPAVGTRIVVIGPSRVDTGETFPITLPENVVLTAERGDVDVRPTAFVLAVIRLAHPHSGIRGSSGATLSIWTGTYGVQVMTGTDDTTFLEDVVVGNPPPGWGVGTAVQVNPRARLTIGEGVTVRGSQIGMAVSGHATVSVPSGHRTTSFSGNAFVGAPPPPQNGWGIFVSGSLTMNGVPGTSPGTGTVVVNDNDGIGINIDQLGVASPPPIVIDGVVVYHNGVSPTPGGYTFSGIFITTGSNVTLRNSVVLANGASGIDVRTVTATGIRRLSDLSKIDLGVAGGLADGGNDYGHNVVQALQGEGENGGAGICLFVDPGSGTLNAAGNVFSGPRDCAGASPGALSYSYICGTHADLGIVTVTDGGLVMDGGGTRGNDINAANCTR